MPEPLKNIYNKPFIKNVAATFLKHQKQFDTALFIREVYKDDWTELELKARMSRIAASLEQAIPGGYKKQIKVLLAASNSFRELEQKGFEYMFLPDFIEQFCLHDFEAASSALADMTDIASGEFAVRPMIKQYGKTMMDLMMGWAQSDSYHIRRLASEGCRPRLPWAMALPEFKQNPSAVLKILKVLKNDPELYVRRSVANNLNDISKDNPQVVVKIAQQWLGKNSETDWVIKHACRGLLKQAQADIMALFGYGDTGHIQLINFAADTRVKFGERLNFSFTLAALDKPKEQALGKLRIEFAIDHMKANGKLARKIFKISESHYDQAIKSIERSHAIRPISTRKYYDGQHQLAILVNGQELHSSQFDLHGVT